jgi:tight adherence protein B
MNIPVIIFVVVFAIVAGLYWLLVLLPESQSQAELRRRLKSEDPKIAELRLLKKEQVFSTIAGLNTVLAKVDGLSKPLKELLDQAGLTLTVGTFVLLSTTSFFGAALLATWYFRGIWWLVLPAAVVAAFIPLFVVRFMRTRRMWVFEEQFPEAVDLIARAMRAGHAFPTGLKMVGEELPPPVGAEFRTLYEKQNFGASMPEILRAFAERIPSLDARFFVTAVLTQREAGGNLAEVLDRLAAVMRERFRIKREVRVRSAHGRISAFVLAGLPPTIAFFMLSTSPESMNILVTDPLGIRLTILAIGLQITGMLIVRKLVDIQY